MEYTVDNLTEEMVSNIWNAYFNEVYGEKNIVTTYVSVSSQKDDSLGLQRSAIGTYHDENDNPMFDFELESGIHRGSLIREIYPPDEGNPLPELTYTTYRFYPKEATPLTIRKLVLSSHVREQAKKMSYDLGVTGCSRATKHWEDYANQIGAKIVSYTGTADQVNVFAKLFEEDPEAAMNKEQE